MRISLPIQIEALTSIVTLSRRSVRARLTLLYGGLFLISGAALLAITYLLFSHATSPTFATHTNAILPSPAPVGSIADLGRLQTEADAKLRLAQEAAARQRTLELHQLLLQSAMALAIMTLISIGVGWVVARRLLRPLRTMTATTRRISEHNLGERLALEGPRDELKELSDTIDGLLARLEVAFAAQKRFVSNASHELRTPLAMMRTSLDVATGKPGPVPVELTRLESKLREGLDQADQLVESFLMLARAEHGAFDEQAEVSLSELLTAAVHVRDEPIREKGIVVEQSLSEAYVRGSRALLARMVGNVLDNAIRHNHPQGWIRLEAQTDGDTIQLLVENGGERLPEGIVRELAEPFRRHEIDRTSTQSGFGLGLSIVSAIATAHGGRLHLHARTEGGLLVIIELPRADGGTPRPAKALRQHRVQSGDFA